jgi:activator of HSP90 ATPase
MDSKKHSSFTGGRASISRKVGGRISAYDGYIAGKNLELESDKKIVQSWRASDWPEGHFSRVSFIIAETAGGSELLFLQEGIPVDFYDNIKQGWIDYYWKPMKEMLESK